MRQRWGQATRVAKLRDESTGWATTSTVLLPAVVSMTMTLESTLKSTIAVMLMIASVACSPNETRTSTNEAPPLSSLPGNFATDVQRVEIEALQALGYVAGNVPAPSASGVTRYDKARTFDGYNLYTSEHAPRVFLLDMNGKLLHMWEVSLPQIDDAILLRRVTLFPNGELLILIERHGLVRLGQDSRVLWYRPCDCHHDFAIAEDESIYVLTRKTAIYPAYNPDKPIRNDAIAVYTSGGEFIREVSMLAAFEASPCCKGYIRPGMHGDVFHSNTLEILDGRLADRNPSFRAGNILTSWRTLNAIGVVDMQSEAVVWSTWGYFNAQHDPTILDSGNLLIFDNHDKHKSTQASRIIEANPFSGKILWTFESTAEFPFSSRTGGANVRLANGNTFITETRGGRAFEVAPDGSVVWIYLNPARVVDDEKMIARVFEMQRLPPDTPMGWLPKRSYPADAQTKGFRRRRPIADGFVK